MLVKCKDNDKIVEVKYNIGDYVRIIDTGGHYSTYNSAFKQFWGNTETSKILNYTWLNRDYNLTKIKYTIWVIKGFLFHEKGYDVLMHLQTIDGKENCVFSAIEDYYYKGERYCQIVKKAKVNNGDDVIELERVKR